MSRIDQLLKFLEESPDDRFLKHALALEYIKAGDLQQAEKMFRNNLDGDPSYVATYYHLGKLLESCGRTDEAADIYEAGMKRAGEAADRHTFSELQAAYEDLTD